jgi:hypothetical protein
MFSRPQESVNHHDSSRLIVRRGNNQIATIDPRTRLQSGAPVLMATGFDRVWLHGTMPGSSTTSTRLPEGQSEG